MIDLKCSVLLLKVLLVLPSTYCEALLIKGTSENIQYLASGGKRVTASDASNFEFIIDECQWRMKTSVKDSKTGQSAECYYDGSSVYSVARGIPRGKIGGINAGEYSAAATVRTGGIPVLGGHQQAIWLTFGSSCLQRTWSNSVPDLYTAMDSDDFGTVAASIRRDSDNQLLAITALRPSMQSKAPTNLLTFQFEVLETTNVDTHRIPLRSRTQLFTEYTDSAGYSTMRLGGEFYITVSTIATTRRDQLQPNAIGEPAFIRDHRFAGHEYKLKYRATNWRSTEDLESDPVTASAIKALRAKKSQDALAGKARPTKQLIVTVIITTILVFSFGLAVLSIFKRNTGIGNERR